VGHRQRSRKPFMTADRARAAALVRAAAEGDGASWDALVAEYGGLIWAITRSYRLTAAEAADVSQTTWLRLCENIDRLRDPGSVGSWLATTARRESLGCQSRSRSVMLFEDMTQVDENPNNVEAVDSRLLREEAAASVREALDQLPGRSRRMLALLMQDEPPTYEEVAAQLDLPIGSIGPTRGRALRRLREILEGGLGETVSTGA
jgi:RNA polymerase sigma factor (sigma-70 family)